MPPWCVPARAAARPRGAPNDRGGLMRPIRKNAVLDKASLTRALAAFRAFLHERGLKVSSVREAVAEAALTYDGHFSVEDLLRVLRAKGVQDAHLATIYRALPLLVEARLIEAAPAAKGDSQRFELAFEREHHNHFVCT